MASYIKTWEINSSYNSIRGQKLPLQVNLHATTFKCWELCSSFKSFFLGSKEALKNFFSLAIVLLAQIIWYNIYHPALSSLVLIIIPYKSFSFCYCCFVLVIFCSYKHPIIFGHRLNISKPVNSNLDMSSHLRRLLKYMSGAYLTASESESLGPVLGHILCVYVFF